MLYRRKKPLSPTGHMARIEQKRDAQRVLVGKPEEKRELTRPRRRLHIRTVLDEIRASNGLLLLRIGTSCGLL
jgi:hypothetical protein